MNLQKLSWGSSRTLFLTLGLRWQRSATRLVEQYTIQSVVTPSKTCKAHSTHSWCRKGYECIKILIAILLIRLKGLKMYKAGVALNLKRVFPLFNTTKVCGERKEVITI